MSHGVETVDTIEFGSYLCLRGVRARFDRNAEVFGEGEPATCIYRVVSGAVRAMRFSSDGRRQILAFYLPGDVFGVETSDKHTTTVEAIGETELVMVRRSLLEKAATEDSRAARCWLDFTAEHLRRAQDHALILGRKGAGERVAAFLLRFAERCVPGSELDLPMSRSDIADYLGLTIETVSRSFTDMERRHAIELPSSRHVVVCNRSTLLQLEAA